MFTSHEHEDDFTHSNCGCGHCDDHDELGYDDEDVYDDPYEVIMYDIDAEADDLYSLIEMLEDSARSWYARRRLNALAASGPLSDLVAAIIIDSLGRRWNPLEHPRDRFGQFIETGGFLRWVMGGLNLRGQVTRIDSDGRIHIRSVGNDNIPDGKVLRFKPEQASKLINIADPKAGLSEGPLPDIDLDADIPDFPEASPTQKRIYNTLQHGDMPAEDLDRAVNTGDLGREDFSAEVLGLKERGLVEIEQGDKPRVRRHDDADLGLIDAGDDEVAEVGDDETPDLEDSPAFTKAQRDLLDRVIEADSGQGDGVLESELGEFDPVDLQELINAGAVEVGANELLFAENPEGGDEPGANAPAKADLVTEIFNAAGERFDDGDLQEAFQHYAEELARPGDENNAELPDGVPAAKRRNAEAAAKKWWEERNAGIPGEDDGADAPEADVPEAEQAKPKDALNPRNKALADALAAEWMPDEKFLDSPKGLDYAEALKRFFDAEDLDEAGFSDLARIKRDDATRLLRKIDVVSEEDIAGWPDAVRNARQADSEKVVPDAPDAPEVVEDVPEVDTPEPDADPAEMLRQAVHGVPEADLPESDFDPDAEDPLDNDADGFGNLPDAGPPEEALTPDETPSPDMDELLQRFMDRPEGEYGPEVMRLRREGLIEDNGLNDWRLTQAGRDRLGIVDEPGDDADLNQALDERQAAEDAISGNELSDPVDAPLGGVWDINQMDAAVEVREAMIDAQNGVISRDDAYEIAAGKVRDGVLSQNDLDLIQESAKNGISNEWDPDREIDFVGDQRVPDESPNTANKVDVIEFGGEKYDRLPEGSTPQFGDVVDVEQADGSLLALRVHDPDGVGVLVDGGGRARPNPRQNYNPKNVKNVWRVQEPESDERFSRPGVPEGVAPALLDRANAGAPAFVPGEGDGVPAAGKPALEAIDNQPDWLDNKPDVSLEGDVLDRKGNPVELGGWYRANKGGEGDPDQVIGFFRQDRYPGWILVETPDGKQKAVNARGDGPNAGLNRKPDPGTERRKQARVQRAVAGDELLDLDQNNPKNVLKGGTLAEVGMRVRFERSGEKNGVAYNAGEEGVVVRIGWNAAANRPAIYVIKPGAKGQREEIQLAPRYLSPVLEGTPRVPTPDAPGAPNAPGANLPDREWEVPSDDELLDRIKGLGGEVEFIPFNNAHQNPGVVYDQVMALVDRKQIEIVPGGEKDGRLMIRLPGGGQPAPDANLPDGAENPYEGRILGIIDGADADGLLRSDLIDVDDEDINGIDKQFDALEALINRGVLERVQNDDPGNVRYRRKSEPELPRGAQNEVEADLLNIIDDAGNTDGVGGSGLVDIDAEDAPERMMALRGLVERRILRRDLNDDGRPVYRRATSGGAPREMDDEEALAALRAGEDPFSIVNPNLSSLLATAGFSKLKNKNSGISQDNHWRVSPIKGEFPIELKGYGAQSGHVYMEKAASGQLSNDVMNEFIAGALSQGIQDSIGRDAPGLLYHPRVSLAKPPTGMGSRAGGAVLMDHAAHGYPEGHEFYNGRGLSPSELQQGGASSDLIGMGLYDYLINNTVDRHSGNRMYVKDPTTGEVRVVVIDNGFGFGASGFSRTATLQQFFRESFNTSDLVRQADRKDRPAVEKAVRDFVSAYQNLDVEATMASIKLQFPGISPEQEKYARDWLTVAKVRVDAIGLDIPGAVDTIMAL